MRAVDYPSVDYVCEALRYEDGRLFWLVRPREHFGDDRTWKRWNTRYSNKEAGSLSKAFGRWMIHVKCGTICRYSIVWAIHNGSWADQIDHKNGNPADDRIENLRLATTSQNNRNRPRNKNNTSGFKGVHLFKRTGKYQVAITVDRHKIHLGYFLDPEEAHEVYLAAAKKYFGEFARGE